MRSGLFSVRKREVFGRRNRAVFGPSILMRARVTRFAKNHTVFLRPDPVVRRILRLTDLIGQYVVGMIKHVEKAATTMGATVPLS